MPVSRWVPGFAAAVALSACMPLMTPAQRLSDSAFEMNSAARFGRMDIAIDHVSAKHREAFAKAHAGWGRSVRIVDFELAGMTMNDDDAEVHVGVQWQRADESIMRQTLITQKWKSDKGWYLVAEQRVGGDAGLFGEVPPVASPGTAAPARASQYQTRHIYEDQPPAE